MRESVREAAGRLAAAGCQTPRLDAEVLLAHALEVRRDVFYREPERPLSAGERRVYETLIARREAREPVAYIVGRRAFRTIEVAVGPGALVPRPETETLVETALRELARLDAAIDRDLGLGAGRSGGEPGVRYVEDVAASGSWTPQVLDLCTGTGCVALALAAEHPGIRVAAVDIDDRALAFARQNAERLGLAERVEFLAGDLFDGLPPAARFELIVANPPYLSEAEIAAVEREIRVYEPRHALVAGPSGLEVYQRLIPEARSSLAPHGLLAVEIHERHPEPVRSLFSRAGFTDVTVVDDLGGAPRVVAGRGPA